jgi:PAS domain S-box-containing protein
VLPERNRSRWWDWVGRFLLRRRTAAGERRRHEVLREGHDHYRELFEHGQGLICIHDVEGRLLDVNPAVTHLLGYDKSDLIGRSIAEVLAPGVRANFSHYLSRIREKDRDSGLMHVMTRGGDELVWMYRNVRVENAGSPPYVLGYAIDVTESLRFEAEKQHYLEAIERQNLDLELRNREIENANRLKSSFVAMMSHELRTPLTAVLGFSDLMADEREHHLDAQQRLYLGFVREGARHLLQLINQILDLSKIEAGRLELSLERIDLRQAIGEVLAAISPLAAPRNISVESTVPAGLEVFADLVRLKQILLNLLSNAVKFTGDGGSVRLSASVLESFVCVSVSDTGIGISTDEQAAIFTEFSPVGTTAKGTREGTGLGLAIVRRLVEQHGGKIWVESEPGRGSCFSFVLPTFRRAAPGIPDPAGPRPLRDRPLVLVADADPATRALLDSYLQAEGYEVHAVSPENAVDRALALRPELITLDVLAPEGGDGWQVLRDLKAASASIPVVVVSVVDEKREGFGLGAAEYLVKPVERGRLVQAARRLAPLPGQTSDAVLIVDDRAEGQRELLAAVLTAGYRPLTTSNGQDALRLLTRIRPGALVMSLLLPEQDAFQTILRLRADPVLSQLPVVVLAAEDLSLDQIRLLSGGPIRVLYRNEESWQRALCGALGQMLGPPPDRRHNHLAPPQPVNAG